jgi:hypothetical protein
MDYCNPGIWQLSKQNLEMLTVQNVGWESTARGAMRAGKQGEGGEGGKVNGVQCRSISSSMKFLALGELDRNQNGAIWHTTAICYMFCVMRWLLLQFCFIVCWVGSYFAFIVFSLYLQKNGVTRKKSDIEFVIASRVNKLFQNTIQRFKDDVKLWITYIKFCEEMVSVCANVPFPVI